MSKMKNKRISKVCKRFKDCPLGWDCLLEIAMTGSALWSVELCYDLIALIESGLIELSGHSSFEEGRIARGMFYTFLNEENRKEILKELTK